MQMADHRTTGSASSGAAPSHGTRRPGKYYYHAYLPQQPDLNWRNAEVQAAMLDVLRFWLGRGVDGFRVDAIHHLFEDSGLADNPPNPEWLPHMSPARSVIRLRTMDQPEVQDAIIAMRKIADSFPGDRVMIGEAYLPITRMMAYYGVDLTGFHLPFNFDLMSTAWNAKAVASLVETYEAALPPGGWPNWVLGNHDRSRVLTRLGEAQARIAAMLLLTLRGTPTICQGEEIGMADVPIAFEHVQDPWERRVPGLGLGRDPVRTPMQWDQGPNAGFSIASPWLPVAPDYQSRNHSAQSGDPRSMLALYQRLLELRRGAPALSVGTYRPILAENNVFVFERTHEGQRVVVALNFDGYPKRLPSLVADRVVLTTHPEGVDATAVTNRTLRGGEGLIMQVGAP